MIKQIRIFAILLSLTFGPMGLTIGGNPFLQGSLATTELPPCELDAPTDLHASVVGTDFLELAWNQSGPPPASYNLKLINTSTGLLVYNMNFLNDGSHKFLVNSLDPGITYKIILTPYCANFNQGPQAEGSATTLILELTLVGFNATNNTPDCEVTASNGSITVWPPGTYCTIASGSTAEFKITETAQNGVSRSFQFTYTDRARIGVQQNNSNYQFLCRSDGSESYPCYSNMIVIKRSGSEVARFLACELDDYPNQIRLFCSTLSSGYKISRIPPSFAPLGDDRDDTLIPASPTTLSASPNPFTHTLEVKIPYATEENDVNINLYDLQGRLVLSEKTTGSTQIRSLSTADLLPGLYLLRVDTGDRTETIKVVKTQ